MISLKLLGCIIKNNERRDVMGSFIDLLDQMWGSTVNSLKFDITNHTIEFKAISTANDTQYFYDIRLKEVISFYWVNDWREDYRKDTENWGFIELSSITSGNKCLIKVDGDDSINQYYSQPHIFIEMWNSMLMVEAKKILINGKEFDLM
jgi:hypothetical protein